MGQIRNLEIVEQYSVASQPAEHFPFVCFVYPELDLLLRPNSGEINFRFRVQKFHQEKQNLVSVDSVRELRRMEPPHVRDISYTLQDGRTHAFKITENSKYQPGHGSILWAGNYVFSYHLLSTINDTLSDKSVLDLGAGLGLSGMCALNSRANLVTLSDYGDSYNHLKFNIELNHLSDKCSVKELDWNSPEMMMEANYSYDVILAIECIYHERIVEPLVKTINYYLKPGGVVYVAGARHRHCYFHFIHLILSLGFSISTEELKCPDENLGRYSNSAELTVGWFSEGDFEYEKNNIILLKCVKNM